jgi:two-component system response regulator AtoC
MDKPVEGFSDEALTALSAYDWPGNVRELRNAVERSLLSCRDMTIELDDLPEKVSEGGGENRRRTGELDEVMGNGLDNWLDGVERRVIISALKKTGGVKVQAAKLLGITERSLWHREKKLEIRVDREVRE